MIWWEPCLLPCASGPLPVRAGYNGGNFYVGETELTRSVGLVSYEGTSKLMTKDQETCDDQSPRTSLMKQTACHHKPPNITLALFTPCLGFSHWPHIGPNHAKHVLTIFSLLTRFLKPPIHLWPSLWLISFLKKELIDRSTFYIQEHNSASPPFHVFPAFKNSALP